MKLSTLFQGIPVSLAFALLIFASPVGAKAQAGCVLLDTAIATPLVLQSAGGTGNRSGLVWNPNDSLYYSCNAGSGGYPFETFAATGGTSLSAPSAGFDFRGIWWNDSLSQLEGNGYNTLGIRHQDLAANGYALGTGTSIFTGMAQPNSQSIGTLDWDSYEILYYNAGSIYRYSRSNNASLGNTALTGITINTNDMSPYSVIYTGCPGKEIGVYDKTNRRLYFFDKSTMTYVDFVQLPASAPQPSFGVAFANNLFWLFNSSPKQWLSYEIFETCPSLNAAVSLQGDSSLCPGDTTLMLANTSPIFSYQWQLNGQDITGATDSGYVANAAGNYTVVITDTGGCQETSAALAIANSPVPSPTISPDSTQWICPGGNVQFSAGTAPGYSWQWQLGGNDISGATDSLYSAGAAGDYSVVVTNAYGCWGISDTVNLSLFTAPVASVSGASGFCAGDSLELTATGGGSYQWWQAGSPIGGATGMNLWVNAAGSYAVTVTDTNGCVDTSAQQVVSQYALPAPVIVMNGDTLSTTQTYATYQWLENGNAISGATQSQYIVTATGTYSVEVTDGNGCVGTSDTTFVFVGLEQEFVDGNFRIYPNPGTDRIHFERLHQASASARLEVIDLQGRTIRDLPLEAGSESTEINISDLRTGFYFLRYREGNRSWSGKFLKN